MNTSTLTQLLDRSRTAGSIYLLLRILKERQALSNDEYDLVVYTLNRALDHEMEQCPFAHMSSEEFQMSIKESWNDD